MENLTKSLSRLFDNCCTRKEPETANNAEKEEIKQ